MSINFLRKIRLRSILVFAALLMAPIVLHASDAERYARCYEGLPFETEPVAAPTIPSLSVELSEYGGIGDGITVNTEAFASAIEDLSSRGGGHLIVSPGVWVTGPIKLKSNIDLHISKGAIILFSPDKSLYPILPADEGTGGALCTPPISASHESNFSITGQGVIDGNGEAWRPVKRFKVSDAEWKKFGRLGLKEVQEGKSAVWYPTLGNADGKIARKRPRLVRFIGCSDFMIQDVVVQNSPSFHVNMILCKRFILDNVMVRCPWNAQNGDGIDLSSCTNALITDCSVDAGDDAICMKSGIGDTGRHRGPTADIVIDGCTVFHGHGGFVIGSDTGGGMNNISVRHCRFIDTDTGLRIKSGRDRGGKVRNIWIDDIVMCDIADEAILFDCYYQEKVGDAADVEAVAVTPDTPEFTGFHISNVTCTDAGRAIVMKGLPESRISDITIRDVSIKARQGVVVNHASDIVLENLTLQIASGDAVSSTGSSNIVERNVKLADL